jgi:hypothetical protein
MLLARHRGLLGRFFDLNEKLNKFTKLDLGPCYYTVLVEYILFRDFEVHST